MKRYTKFRVDACNDTDVIQEKPKGAEPTPPPPAGGRGLKNLTAMPNREVYGRRLAQFLGRHSGGWVLKAPSLLSTEVLPAAQ